MSFWKKNEKTKDEIFDERIENDKIEYEKLKETHFFFTNLGNDRNGFVLSWTIEKKERRIEELEMLIDERLRILNSLDEEIRKRK